MGIRFQLDDDPLLQDNFHRPVLVLGLGNILLHDEGIGVRVVQHLHQHYRFPPEVEVMDGGTAGMALFEHIIERRHLIVIDAVKTGDPPGTLVTLEREAVPAYFRTRVSPHQMALSDILAALQIAGHPLPETVLFGVVPVRLSTGIGLSYPVAKQLNTLVEMTLDRLKRMDREVRPRMMH
jgi:hydrogenase maturation protease